MMQIELAARAEVSLTGQYEQQVIGTSTLFSVDPEVVGLH
jgi:hypothetical protein